MTFELRSKREDSNYYLLSSGAIVIKVDLAIDIDRPRSIERGAKRDTIDYFLTWNRRMRLQSKSVKLNFQESLWPTMSKEVAEKCPKILSIQMLFLKDLQIEIFSKSYNYMFKSKWAPAKEAWIYLKQHASTIDTQI